MSTTDFQIIYDKLAEEARREEGGAGWVILSEADCQELDEIAELARLAEELAIGDVTCYTTT